MFLILVRIFLLFLGFTSNEYSFEITHINTLVQMFKEKCKPDLGSLGSYEPALSRLTQKPLCILPETLPVPIALEPQGHLQRTCLLSPKSGMGIVCN